MPKIGIYSSAVPKLKQKPTTFKVRLYSLVEDAIENGIAAGWRRAHKHTDKPGEDHIKTEILQYVMLNLCELIDFEVDAN